MILKCCVNCVFGQIPCAHREQEADMTSFNKYLLVRFSVTYGFLIFVFQTESFGLVKTDYSFLRLYTVTKKLTSPGAEKVRNIPGEVLHGHLPHQFILDLKQVF